jgi:protein ImuB
MDKGALMYAALHTPDFHVQAVAHRQPELRKQPMVLLDGEPPQEIVFATNKQARALGIQTAMSRLQAESFTAAAVMHRILECEDTALAILHTIACFFSPRIEAIATHPGTYVLDIQGMSSLFGDAAQLANKLRQRIMAAGFLANIAVSENFHAAVCLARGRTGVSIVPPENEAKALGPLLLQVLDLEPEQTDMFSSWGIRTCAEVAALSETDLIARIGQSGKRLHALARGEWPHLMIPVETSFESELVESVELDHPVEMLEPLLFLLARMIDQLLTRVLSHSRAIASLQVILKLERDVDGKFHTHQRIIRPALPLQDARTLLKLLQLDLEAHPPKAAIVALELHAQSAKPHRAQHGLFLPQAPEPGRLEVLLARLRKLLGDERVGSPELLDQHRPDAFRMARFSPPAPKLKEQQPAFLPAALRVCRPPQAIGVALNGVSPTQVFWNRQQYNVTERAGPWRLSGQWWSESNWSREEWDVRLTGDKTGQTCRIARDPRSNCWYMQGTYD